MEKVIDVNTGDVRATREAVILRSVAIGSCIVIAAIDTTKRVGAMAHVMLPGAAPALSSEKTRYCENAIEKLIQKMELRGSEVENIEVCLVGAGNVLKEERDTVCQGNIKSVTDLLKEKAIRVRCSVLGGTERKSVFFDLSQSRMTYTEGDSSEKLLWQQPKKTPPKLHRQLF